VVTGTEFKFLGIYACQIKPTSLLTSFLNENKRLGILDLSALEFHPYKQRAEKRLVRYLSVQWFIRMTKNKLNQTFRVKTLVNEMDFGARLRGTDIYDRFVSVLNTLKETGFIQSWSFTEEVDFSRFGKKGWLPYFHDLKVIITPSKEIIEKNKRKYSILKNHYGNKLGLLDDVVGSIQQMEAINQDEFVEPINAGVDQQPEKKDKIHPLIKEDTLTPEMVIQERNRRSISITKAANEIGIGYNTLKRFENKETKRRNKNNDEKIVKWLNESLKNY
jgi:Mn-dependent DtxR family transcriptional regulator